ncbi:uncharacterized protein LOC104436465 isoform X1 [Eucalyptus grandis]|uniref:uncharacterized protein LOC104436465 isoform X1 n=1 Tax=Eucalyptus grandis TaxID=71139 RepID=UPI00192E8CB3|nr:uncharacterized protein LOC104436465 isoform X1 [Eucalyptus grandis]
MADAKTEWNASPTSDDSSSEPRAIQRPKEDDKSPHHHRETHGRRKDIDENTPLSDVKAPNVFERAKEEIEALVQTIHLKKESPTREKRDQTVQTESSASGSPSVAENDGKGPNFIEKAKQEIEGIMHFKKSPRHHRKETHGLNEDIDENTPIDEVKAPNVFERAKEEIEAIAQAIHPKKESSNDALKSPKKEHGFRYSIGKGLEKVCSPLGHKRD